MNSSPKMNKNNRKQEYNADWKSIWGQTKENLWQVTQCLQREDWQMNRINRPAFPNNRRNTLFTSLFLPPFHFTLQPPPPTTSHFALIQLCICILNDSITWDPAVKITDVFHYFSPLGHHDPSSAPITPLPPTSFSSFLHPSLLASLSTCPICLLSHSCPFFLINIRFAVSNGYWEEIIAKWSCLWALCTLSWQRVFCG